MNKREIKKEFADKFIAKYKDYGVTKETKHWQENGIDQEGIYLIIKDPHGVDISVMYDGNHVTDNEMILFYSDWHIHIFDYFPEEEENYADCSLKNLSNYIDEILQGVDLTTL